VTGAPRVDEGPAPAGAGPSVFAGKAPVSSWFPEDLIDRGEQLLGRASVGAALGPGPPGEFGGLVEQLVQLRVLLEVRSLEIVGPQHPQVVFDQLGPLFLDDQAAGPELGARPA
jgi:hypothetical protein